MQLFVVDGFIDWEEVSARIAENPNIKCEYEQQQDTVIGIGKRMTERYDWWKANTNDKLVLNIVKNGYELPFDTTPQRKNCKNSQSAYEHEAFVTEAIQELVKAGSAIKIQEQPHIVAALSVDDKKPDKLRLIWDGRPVNVNISLNKRKWQTLHDSRHSVSRGTRFIKLDLKSGYHHVPIATHCWKYMGFEWNGEWYVYTVLPFGLSPAPEVFMKVTNVLVKKWRREGINVILHWLDDFVFDVGFDKNLAMDIVKHILKDFHDSGLVVSYKKSEFDCDTIIEAVGFVIDSTKYVFKAPMEFQEKFIRFYNQTLKGRKRVPARLQAKFCGLLQCKRLAYGCAVGFYSKPVYAIMNQAAYWNQYVDIDTNTRELMQDFINRIHDFNGQDIQWPADCSVLDTDASDFAYGATLWEKGLTDGHIDVSNMLPAEVVEESSTYRELYAILRAIQKLQNPLASKKVKRLLIRTDSQSAFWILLKGRSHKQPLHELARDIFFHLLNMNITWKVEWIPRGLNQYADYLSKIIDKNDWMVSLHLFYTLEQRWGPHTIDRMASSTNAILSRYNSKFYDPQAEACNCFTQDWKRENNWVNPELDCIADCIQHCRSCKASMTILLPYWLNMPWWSLLVDNNGHWRTFIVDVYWLDKRQNNFIPGKHGTLLGLAPPNFDIVALRCMF